MIQLLFSGAAALNRGRNDGEVPSLQSPLTQGLAPSTSSSKNCFSEPLYPMEKDWACGLAVQRAAR